MEQGDAAGAAVDVAIVGGGLAGLAAAWHLRGRSLAVFEAAGGVGGRVASAQAGATLNLGAHMVPGPGSLVGGLVAELGLATRGLPPRLIGMLHEGRRHLAVPPGLLPLALRLGPAERLAFLRMGARLRLGAARSLKAGRPQPGDTPEALRARLLAFEDGRTLAGFVGPLPPRVARIFRALTERNGADPEAMSAGHGLRSFANVWARSAPGRALVGGTGVLPAALAGRLGAAVLTGHRVTEVRRLDMPAGPRVLLHYRTAQGGGSLLARACILATPAPVTRALAPDLPEGTRAALAAIRYGPFLSLAVGLRPLADAPWAATYAIATPGLGFSVLFNHAAMQTEPGAATALMLFRGASGAAEQMESDDTTLTSRWLADLERSFPETRGRIADVQVGRWPLGAPHGFPGRAALQPVLQTPAPPLWLAGDYLDFPNMEAAAQAGAAAARAAEAWLDRPG